MVRERLATFSPKPVEISAAYLLLTLSLNVEKASLELLRLDIVTKPEWLRRELTRYFRTDCGSSENWQWIVDGWRKEFPDEALYHLSASKWLERNSPWNVFANEFPLNNCFLLQNNSLIRWQRSLIR
jgi:hypothetical protein